MPLPLPYSFALRMDFFQKRFKRPRAVPPIHVLLFIRLASFHVWAKAAPNVPRRVRTCNLSDGSRAAHAHRTTSRPCAADSCRVGDAGLLGSGVHARRGLGMRRQPVFLTDNVVRAPAGCPVAVAVALRPCPWGGKKGGLESQACANSGLPCCSTGRRWHSGCWRRMWGWSKSQRRSRRDMEGIQRPKLKKPGLA